MTPEQITVPKQTWDAMMEALNEIICAHPSANTMRQVNAIVSGRTALAAAKAVQPQAQGEAIYQYQGGDGLWRDQTKQSYDYNVKHGAKGVRIVYAHPQASEPAKRCWCETCRPVTLGDMRMVVCPDCGNKRCPKATHHNNACTNSNEIGQKGSSWEHVQPVAAKAVQQPAWRTGGGIPRFKPQAQDDRGICGEIRGACGLPCEPCEGKPDPEWIALHPQASEPAPAGWKLIGWRTADYLRETDDPKMAKNWGVHYEILPIFEGDANTKLAAAPEAK